MTGGKREEIMEAAKEAFAEKGYSAVGIREIARASGINSATLYHYFRNKEEIYSAVLERTFEKIVDILNEIEDLQFGKGEIVREAIGKYIDFINDNRDFLKILIHELNLDTEMVVKVSKKFYDSFFKAAQEMIETRRDSEGVREMDPKHLLISGIGLCTIHFILAPLLNILEGKDQLTPEMLEERKDAVVDLMLYGVLKK